MSIEIKVPAMGESVTEATVARWFKKEGDASHRDEPLLELETDKVTVEVPAPAAGAIESISRPGRRHGAGGRAPGRHRRRQSRHRAAAKPAAAPKAEAPKPAAPAPAAAAPKPQRQRLTHRPCRPPAASRKKPASPLAVRRRHRPGRPRHQGRHAGRAGSPRHPARPRRRAAPAGPRANADARRKSAR